MMYVIFAAVELAAFNRLTPQPACPRNGAGVLQEGKMEYHNVKFNSEDRTKAEAIRIAIEVHRSSGWKFQPEDIGYYAAKIINSLNGSLQ